MKKILLDNTSFFPIVGGTETYYYQLMKLIDSSKVNMKLLCNIPIDGIKRINNFEIKRVGEFGIKSGYDIESIEFDKSIGLERFINSKEYAIKTMNRLNTLNKIGLKNYYLEFERFKPDLVMVNDFMRIISVPYIQHVPWIYNTKILVNLHGILTSFKMIWDMLPSKKEIFKEMVHCNEFPIYFIAPSKYVYNTALEWGIKKEKLKLIYLGIDTKTFIKPSKNEKIKIRKEVLKRLKLDISDNTIIIGFPSRAVSHKGIDTALESLNLLKKRNTNLKWFFLIAGGASDNPESIIEINKLILKYELQENVFNGIDNFTNYPEDMYNFNATCDICLFPSRREALGYGALENMAVGVPVIGTNIPGLSEALGIKEYDKFESPGGWFVSPEKPYELSILLERIISKPEIIENKGNKSREWVEKNFSIEKMVNEHILYFNDII